MNSQVKDGETQYLELLDLLEAFMDRVLQMVVEKVEQGLPKSLGEESNSASQELMQASGIIEVVLLAYQIFKEHLPAAMVRGEASKPWKNLMAPGLTFVVDRWKGNH